MIGTAGILLRAIGVSVLAGGTLLATVPGALAQDGDQQQKLQAVKPTENDKQAAHDAKVVYRKAWLSHRNSEVPKSKLVYRAKSKPSNSTRDSDENAVRFPGDLTFQGGHTVEFAESHDIFLQPTGQCQVVATCWGNPGRFLQDLGKSEFIHVTDQYVGEHASGRYDLGRGAKISYTMGTQPLLDTDMQAVVHAVALKTGETGYRHIYHVFLAPGQDECFDGGFTVCASNVFCAYHSSVDFKDIGHVLYTVQPFMDVPGCQVRPGTPNGTLVDSTNSALSHELIETITDPDGDGWWNTRAEGNFGQEIADECVFLLFTSTGVFTDPAIIDVSHRKYALQPEYSNHAHACVAEN